MYKYFYIRKNTKQLAMISNGRIKIDNNFLEEKKKIITEKKLKEINNSEITYIKKDKFIIKPKKIDKKLYG